MWARSLVTGYSAMHITVEFRYPSLTQVCVRVCVCECVSVCVCVCVCV